MYSARYCSFVHSPTLPRKILGLSFHGERLLIIDMRTVEVFIRTFPDASAKFPQAVSILGENDFPLESLQRQTSNLKAGSLSHQRTARLMPTAVNRRNEPRLASLGP